MLSFILLITLCIVGLRADEVPCETGQEICPRGFRCLSGTGCVPVNGTGACREPVQPCVWPQESDCKGGCALRDCGTSKPCAKTTNPDNACEITICRATKCVAATLGCANCNPKTGCKPGTRGVNQDGASDEPQVKDVTTDDTAPDTFVDENAEADWWHHHHHDKSATVIGLYFFFAFIGAVCLALGIYFSFYITRT